MDTNSIGTAQSNDCTLSAIWSEMCREAQRIRETEPFLRNPLYVAIAAHNSFPAALHSLLTFELGLAENRASGVGVVIGDLVGSLPEIASAAARDLMATVGSKSGFRCLISAFLYGRGFHALQAYRVAHELWRRERYELAYFLQHLSRKSFAMDIHPAAVIGSGVFIPNPFGFVLGASAIVEDGVLLPHSEALLRKYDRVSYPNTDMVVSCSVGDSVVGEMFGDNWP
jgi:serine O-acetyltransferase